MRHAHRAELRALLLAGLCTTAAAQALAQTGAKAPAVRVATDVGGLEAASAALVLSGQQGGGLAASVLVFPFPGSTPETTRLALVVDLAAASLAPPGEPSDTAAVETDATDAAETAADGPMIVEVHAYALAPGDVLSGHLTQAFALDREELAAATGRAGIKFLGALEVPPGEWSVRLLVRERRSGRLALRALTVMAPDFAGGKPVLLPPLFPDPAERWLLVRQAGGAGAPPFPLDLGASAAGAPGQRAGWLVPSTRPVVEPGGRVFYLAGRGLESAAGGWTARLFADAAGRSDREDPEAVPLRITRLGALAAGSGPGGELTLWQAELDPGALASGPGVLAIAAPGGVGISLPAVLLSAELDLAGAGGGAGEVPAGMRLWTDLLGAAGRAEREPAPTLTASAADAGEITDEELSRFQAAYLRALGHLAGGHRPAALAAVEEVERSGMERGTAAGTLARGQLQVALDVSGGAVEQLLPLIQLHGDLYREYLQGGRPSLAAHARRVTLGLLDLYARDAGESEDRGRVAAAALVGLAGQLLEAGNSLESISVLELALEHDPEQPAALLTLAEIYEMLGDYPRVVTLLRRLEQVTEEDDPVGAEGRLRLGVNLVRTGAERAAAEYLAAAQREDRPPWIRVVASQETAALLAGQGQPQQAAEQLEQAVEQMPGELRLYIQLAALYETLGRPVDARGILERLEARVRRGLGRDRDSPRLRYCQWSAEALEASRQLFERAATARLPALAEALAGFSAMGG